MAFYRAHGPFQRTWLPLSFLTEECFTTAAVLSREYTTQEAEGTSVWAGRGSEAVTQQQAPGSLGSAPGSSSMNPPEA